MDWKKYFDADLRTTLFFTLAGIVAGYLSFASGSNIASAAIMLILLLAGRFAMQRMLKEKKDAKWWLGNGIIVYIFVWFIVWTVFYNTMV